MQKYEAYELILLMILAVLVGQKMEMTMKCLNMQPFSIKKYLQADKNVRVILGEIPVLQNIFSILD